MRKMTAKAPCSEISRSEILSKEVYDCVKRGLCICAVYIYVILRMDGENCLWPKFPAGEKVSQEKIYVSKEACMSVLYHSFH